MNNPISFSSLRPNKGMGSQELLALQAAKRQKIEGTGLASAARTAETLTSTITADDCNGIFFWIQVTVASGFGLRPFVYPYNHMTAAFDLNRLHANFTLRSTTGTFSYLLHPSVTSYGVHADTEGAAVIVPRRFCIGVTLGSVDPVTYSLGYVLIP
jgi:hypothetical protein